MGDQKFSKEFLDHQFKPGQSGNPAGRPKNKTFEEYVRGILAEVVPGTEILAMDALARVYVKMMLSGKGSSMKAIKAFMAREWPEVQRHALTDTDGRDMETDGNPAWSEFTRRMDLLEKAEAGDDRPTPGRGPGEVLQ